MERHWRWRRVRSTLIVLGASWKTAFMSTRMCVLAPGPCACAFGVPSTSTGCGVRISGPRLGIWCNIFWRILFRSRGDTSVLSSFVARKKGCPCRSMWLAMPIKLLLYCTSFAWPYVAAANVQPSSNLFNKVHLPMLSAKAQIARKHRKGTSLGGVAYIYMYIYTYIQLYMYTLRTKDRRVQAVWWVCGQSVGSSQQPSLYYRLLDFKPAALNG